MADHDLSAVSILLVEDDEDDYVLARDLLADSRRTRFALDWVSSYDEALEALTADAHDIYLIDYRLGEHDGLELLAHARASGVTAPLILLTGQGDGDVDLAAMREGAADYLIKGQIDARLLERSIRYALEQNRTLHALRESEERYALSARGANDGLWVWDLRTNDVYYSERWKSMLGHSDGQVGSDSAEWLSRVHPDDLPALRESLDRHLRGETPHLEHEHRMRCSEGDYRWMLSRGLAVRDSSGVATLIAGSQTDVTERKLAVDRLTYDAFHDPLTHLSNRALFMNRLDHAMETQRRHPEALFAVLFLDLDRFKVVNDSLGHIRGDELLIAVGRRLAAVLRSEDTVARLGGDEFAVLIHVESVRDALVAAQRIDEALEAPFVIGPHEIFTTASIGIALSASSYERPQDMLRDADIAMYRAKAGGRSRHEVFDSAMHERAVKMLSFETDLRRAVERNELRVHYQPLVSLASGTLTGFEALIRWQRGSELVGAVEVISVAEDTGLIVPIGEWVLGEALREAKGWDESLSIHVNLSPRQLLQPNLVERVRALLEDSGVDPRRLHFEVTESVLIHNAEAAHALLCELRDLQVRLSLDDFGTGYSSLSSLRDFPFDTLKIDRSFLLDSDTRRSGEIVRTVANLARLLGMEVTVEGLETDEQVTQMRAIGIEYGQGFHFSRPVTSTDAAELARQLPLVLKG